MRTAKTPQLAPNGGSSAFIKVTHDLDGHALNPPQRARINDVTGIDDIKDTLDLKEIHGSGAYPIALVGGKRKQEFSITTDSYSGALLNGFYYGAEAQSLQRHAQIDNTGYVIPNNASRNIKILNVITVHLGRFDSDTSVTIAGSTASKISSGTPVAGQYKVTSGGKYSFASGDKGKTAVITYVSNSITLVTTVNRIPDSLTFNVTRFSSTKTTVKNDLTALTKESYSATVAPTAANKFQFTSNGVYVFNSAMALASGKKLSIDHLTDDVSVKTTIAALPAAAYSFYVDPQSDSLYLADDGVVLAANSGASMGLAVGDTLTKVASNATLATGQYKVDDKGYYQFYSADAGDNVTLYWQQDYYFITVNLPDDATFVDTLAVRTQGGISFTQVAYASPLAIETDQYYNSGTAQYGFDYTNAGETVFIDVQYEKVGGNMIAIKNHEAGKSPTFSIVMYNRNADGEEVTVIFDKCKCKGIGIPMKQDPSQLKFECMAFADRVTGSVGSISTSS